LCQAHYAYLWLCGGVAVNYHTLADFRTGTQGLLDRLLTQSVGVLLEAGLVSLKRVAQDGMRVRASAGAASFRREATLRKRLAEAEAQVAVLRGEVAADPGAGARRRLAALGGADASGAGAGGAGHGGLGATGGGAGEQAG